MNHQADRHRLLWHSHNVKKFGLQSDSQKMTKFWYECSCWWTYTEPPHRQDLLDLSIKYPHTSYKNIQSFL